ncbi:hypothetical protein ACVBIO_04690 [Shewanella sp. 0m-8]
MDSLADKLFPKRESKRPKWANQSSTNKRLYDVVINQVNLTESKINSLKKGKTLLKRDHQVLLSTVAKKGGTTRANVIPKNFPELCEFIAEKNAQLYTMYQVKQQELSQHCYIKRPELKEQLEQTKAKLQKLEDQGYTYYFQQYLQSPESLDRESKAMQLLQTRAELKDAHEREVDFQRQATKLIAELNKNSQQIADFKRQIKALKDENKSLKSKPESKGNSSIIPFNKYEKE